MADGEKKKDKEKEEGVRFNIEDRSGDSSAADAEDGEIESDIIDPELEATLPPITPRPSITAAIRRGSYYGDVTPRVSIMEALSSSELDLGWSERSSSSTAGSANTEEGLSSVEDDEDEELLSNKFRVYILGFLEGMLERLSLVVALSGLTSDMLDSMQAVIPFTSVQFRAQSALSSISIEASACGVWITDTSVVLQDVPDGLPIVAEKKELLDAANLIHFSLGIPSKLSKFAIEAAWLTEVLTKVKKEVEDSSSFSVLQDIMDKDEMKIRRLPASITHVKELKGKMSMLNVLIEAEAQTHKEAMREWAKNIAEQKNELKELRADNMVQYRYKADTALASEDLFRRDYEVRLINLRAENVQLKNDLEVERKVHKATVEFLKKQNIDLREEAVALQANFEVDAHNLDHMLEKIKLQRKEKELVLAELELRYMKEMAKEEAARLEAINKQEYFYANQGKCELELVATMRIQRIWRGYLVRKVYRKVLRKLKRKRLKAKKKGKKGKKGGTKRRSGAKKR